MNKTSKTTVAQTTTMPVAVVKAPRKSRKTTVALEKVAPLTPEELAEQKRIAAIPALVTVKTKGGETVRPLTKKEFKLLPAMNGKNGGQLKKAYNEMLREHGPKQKANAQHFLLNHDVAVRSFRTGNSGNSWSCTMFRLSALTDDSGPSKATVLATENEQLGKDNAALRAERDTMQARLAALEAKAA